MTRLCETCGHYYDDEFCWTQCPHGPLWAPLDAYCREHDLVNCKLHHGEPHEYAQLARSSGAAFVDTPMFRPRLSRLSFSWNKGFNILGVTLSRFVVNSTAELYLDFDFWNCCFRIKLWNGTVAAPKN
jgi:hypothetical protein